MKKLIDAGKELHGTAREAKENFTYDQLVKKYDKHTVDKLISEQLKTCGISLSQFETYKMVRSKIHKGGLDIKEAFKTAEKETTAMTEFQEFIA